MKFNEMKPEYTANTKEKVEEKAKINDKVSVDELITALENYLLISQEEINNLKRMSVSPLGDKVVNKAEELKTRLTALTADTQDGLVSLLDTRVISLFKLVKAINQDLVSNKAELKELIDKKVENYGSGDNVKLKALEVEGKIKSHLGIEFQNNTAKVNTRDSLNVYSKSDVYKQSETYSADQIDGKIDLLETKEDATSKLNEAKGDATTKANQALLDAKDYVDNFREATQSVKGFMSASDKQKLDFLYQSLTGQDTDQLVNTIKEILDIFEQYPEGEKIAEKFANIDGALLGLSNRISTLNNNKVDKNTYATDKTAQHGINQELDNATKTNLQSITNLNRRANDLESRAETIEGNITTINGNVSTLNSNLNGLVNVVDKVDKKLVISIKDLADLKEALYGYVLDTANVEVSGTIPNTTTVGSTTYNLVDNVHNLVSEINGETKKSDNLLILEDVPSTTVSGLTYKVENGVVYLSGVPSTPQSLFLRIKSTKLEQDAQYMFKSFYPSSTSGISIALRKTFTDTSDNVPLNFSGNIFTGSGKDYAVFLMYVTTTYSGNVTVSPMIVKGTTAPTEFSQGFEGLKSVNYEGLRVEGVNKYNINNSQEVEAYIGGDGNLKFSSVGNTIVLKIKEATRYYIKTSENYNSRLRIAITDSLKSFENDSSVYVPLSYLNQIGYATDITTPSNAHYMYINFDDNDDLFNLAKLNLVISEKAISSYTPYTSKDILSLQATLRGVGTSKDKIVISKNDNDLYTATLVRMVGEVDLGSMTRYVPTYKLFFGQLSNQSIRRTSNVICSKYDTSTKYYTDSNNKSCGIIVDDNATFGVVDNEYNDLESFKNANNGIKAYYELATPTTEVLSTTLTYDDVMPILELGGSVEIINDNSDFVSGSTNITMLYRKTN